MRWQNDCILENITHAEKHALSKAPKSGIFGTLFVTLEPCCHFGRTPPCTDAIIEAGIKRVIMGTTDPNPAVNQKGIEVLRRKGIEVDDIKNPELKAMAEAQLKPFTMWIKEKRPYVLAKIASSFDQKIALVNQRLKITCEQSDEIVHALRRAADAVMVGKNTVVIDNPMLTARLKQEGMHQLQPIRVVLSRDLSFLDDKAQIFDRSAKTIVLTGSERDRMREQAILNRGAEIFLCDVNDNEIDISSALTVLAHRGITSLMVEPGQQLFFSLMKKTIPDEVWWFRSKNIVGEGGLFVPIKESLHEKGYILHHQQMVGVDEMSVFMRA